MINISFSDPARSGMRSLCSSGAAGNYQKSNMSSLSIDVLIPNHK